MKNARLNPVATRPVQQTLGRIATGQVRHRKIGEWIEIDCTQDAGDRIARLAGQCIAMIERPATCATSRVENAVEDAAPPLVGVEPSIQEVAKEPGALRIAVGDQPAPVACAGVHRAALVAMLQVRGKVPTAASPRLINLGGPA